jgi:hypothetical protein
MRLSGVGLFDMLQIECGLKILHGRCVMNPPQNAFRILKNCMLGGFLLDLLSVDRRVMG